MKASASVLSSALVLGVLLGACDDDDTVEVEKVYVDSDANFSSYQTFAFGAAPSDAGTGDSVQAALHRAKWPRTSSR